MARMRKSARLWRDPGAQALADSALVFSGPLSVFSVEPNRLFERDAPLEIEIGAGKGDFIVEHAAAIPGHNFLAVDLAPSVLRLLALRAAGSRLANLKVLRADARTMVNLLLPDNSVSAYHIYFPDPWPKDRHAKHRLFSPFFVANIARTLALDGIVYFASDVRDYAERIRAMLEAGGFRAFSQEAPGERRSNFGRKYAAAGRAVFAGSFMAPAIERTPMRQGPESDETPLLKALLH